jgi:hypothetical protein
MTPESLLTDLQGSVLACDICYKQPCQNNGAKAQRQRTHAFQLLLYPRQAVVSQAPDNLCIILQPCAPDPVAPDPTLTAYCASWLVTLHHVLLLSLPSAACRTGSCAAAGVPAGTQQSSTCTSTTHTQQDSKRSKTQSATSVDHSGPLV